MILEDFRKSFFVIMIKCFVVGAIVYRYRQIPLIFLPPFSGSVNSLVARRVPAAKPSFLAI